MIGKSRFAAATGMAAISDGDLLRTLARATIPAKSCRHCRLTARNASCVMFLASIQ